jgi:tRNA (guanine37-N1)-methyltransferase
MIKINILTLFPAMFNGFLTESIPFIAQREAKMQVVLTDIRDFSGNKHRKVDDYQFGGGAGMVLTPEPLARSIEFTLNDRKNIPIIYFTPQGRLLKQSIIREYLKCDEIILLCGHYKEIDHRIREKYITDEISIGDYILSGGELPAMVFVDAIARLLDGVINDPDSALTDSHENGLLGYPCYTRPANFEGMEVPNVLINGHHAKIEQWRLEKSLEMTKRIRPDLLEKLKDNE